MKNNEGIKSFITFCRDQLSSHKEASDYLQERKISQQSIEDFELGVFSLSQLDDLPTGCKEELIQHGILFQNEKDKSYFTLACPCNSNSIMFPFYNAYKELVAISFRPIIANKVIKEHKIRKYWHTSFLKRFFLYGLYRIPNQVDNIIVGEGQFDVITAHQYGFKNVIAVCGVALTDKHISAISKRTTEAIIMFDGDKAGLSAIEKTESLKKVGGIELKKSILPTGEDIDSFLHNYGAEKFKEILNAVQPV